MERSTRIKTTENFDKNCRYIRDYLTEWKILIDKVYSSRKEAYNAIDDFIHKYNKYPLLKTRYKLTPDCFAIGDAEKWFEEGFDCEDEYRSYNAYTH